MYITLRRMVKFSNRISRLALADLRFGAREEDEFFSRFLGFLKNFLGNYGIQECIPVGCVPSAAVAVSPATHAPLPCMSPLPYPPCHTCPCHVCPPPSPTTHAYRCHACPSAMDAPPPCMSLPCMPPPCMPPPCHACPHCHAHPCHKCSPCHACPPPPCTPIWTE